VERKSIAKVPDQKVTTNPLTHALVQYLILLYLGTSNQEFVSVVQRSK